MSRQCLRLVLLDTALFIVPHSPLLPIIYQTSGRLTPQRVTRLMVCHPGGWIYDYLTVQLRLGISIAWHGIFRARCCLVEGLFDLLPLSGRNLGILLRRQHYRKPQMELKSAITI